MGDTRAKTGDIYTSNPFPESDMNKTLLFLGVVALALFLLPTDALASAGTGGDLPYEGFLEGLRNSVTGPVAYTISLLAIVVSCAALAFGGDIQGFARTLLILVLIIRPNGLFGKKGITKV